MVSKNQKHIEIMLIRILYMFFSFLLVHNCSNAQLNNNKSNFKDDRFSFGVFMNIIDAEFEFMLNLKNQYGFYGNIWTDPINHPFAFYELLEDQADLFGTTSDDDIQYYSSFGYNSEINESLSLDFGFIGSFDLGIDGETFETFIGINYNAISLWAYIAENSISLESWYKPSFNFLDNNNLDLLFYGYFYDDGYDFSFNISRQLSQSIIFGFMFGYENYSNIEYFSYQKNNDIKTYSYDSGYNGWNNQLYMGLLFK